jgi:hypothetical protein
MTRVHTPLIALLLAAAGIAQASEISESPKAVSTRDRAAVLVEARWAQPSNELYDGTHGMKPMAAARTREQVRVEAAAAKPIREQLALRDYLGGM